MARTQSAFRPTRWCLPIWICLMGLPAIAQQTDKDSDGDGLSDFQEKYKYLTDANNSDSDGDGTPDGDWLERREYQYTIRSVVQVMRPVTPKYLNDNYQDARVLDEADTWVELEVIHYPFNQVDQAITANENWREDARGMQQWIEPGPSSDWTPEMQRELKAALRSDQIDSERLSDRELVEKASRWLCEHAEYQDGFTSFVTGWDDSGNPFVPDELLESAERGMSAKNRSLEEQWEREVSAAGMFKNKTRGSCTSSAIYLNGCLKALGIPTRTILCIPVIDAGDEREMQMLNRISHPGVRQHLKQALQRLENSWASHTFNEVFVGGQWHRLNYNRLGQGIYDRDLFGLLTHVATVNDWADAKAHTTIGQRQKSRVQGTNDLFGFNNPYSAISLRDEYGKHCQLELPAEQKTIAHSIEKIYWTDDPNLPEAIVDHCRRRGRFGIIAVVKGSQSMDEFLNFLAEADLRIMANPQGTAEHPQLEIGFDPGCFWFNRQGTYIYVPFGGGEKRDLVMDVEYELKPRDESTTTGWKMAEKLTIVRERDLPK